LQDTEKCQDTGSTCKNQQVFYLARTNFPRRKTVKANPLINKTLRNKGVKNYYNENYKTLVKEI
jgi:hypothetical protein